MLSSFGIRACQAEAPREGMAYPIFFRKFFSAGICQLNLQHSPPGWAATRFGQALKAGGRCGLHNGCCCRGLDLPGFDGYSLDAVEVLVSCN